MRERERQRERERERERESIKSLLISLLVFVCESSNVDFVRVILIVRRNCRGTSKLELRISTKFQQMETYQLIPKKQHL